MYTSWDIVGHGWAVEYLRRSIHGGHSAHAYLFAGPAHIGKGTLALRLAQALICERGAADPCLTCRACRRVANGNHPDVRTVSLATQADAKKADEPKSRELGIDAVRAWQRDIDLRPFEASRRVFILEDAETLTDQAANAMLKTLEEPPPHAVLILVAHVAGDLLPTIVSRCRVLRLRPVDRQTIAAALQRRYNVTPADAELLAAWSGGRFGCAAAAMNDPDILEQQHARLDVLAGLRAAGVVARLKWAEERAKDYRASHATIDDWLVLWQSWWRDVMLIGSGCTDGITFVERQVELAEVASAVALPQVHRFLRHLERTREQLADNVNPQLALENLALHLP